MIRKRIEVFSWCSGKSCLLFKGEQVDQFLFNLFIFVLIVFLILRGFWCWYWKINKIVSLLELQNKLLSQILWDGVGKGDSVRVEVESLLGAQKKSGVFSFFSGKGNGESGSGS
jgi:hypothetical protein